MIQAIVVENIAKRFEKVEAEDIFVKITGIEAQTVRKEKEKGGGGQCSAGLRFGTY